MASAKVRHVVGCMTGTSIDALDAALVRIEGEGLAMRATFVRAVTRPLGGLAPRLRAVAEQAPTPAGDIARLSREFSLLHVGAIRELLGSDRADLIAVHGQTVFHVPPASWQLLTPAVIAQALKTPVVFDLRAADLAAGGQGAPITPLADWVFFRRLEGGCNVVNLGGYCNVSHIPAAALNSLEGIDGKDVCACNHVLDQVARVAIRQPFDRDGATAIRGKVHEEAWDFLHHWLMAEEGESDRSLGTGDEQSQWVAEWAARLSAADLAATACDAVASTICSTLCDTQTGVCGHVGHNLFAGGGVLNRCLMQKCREYLARADRAASLTDEHGIPAAYREAAAMAVLGALCQDRVPITLSAVTGVKEPPVAGCWVMP